MSKYPYTPLRWYEHLLLRFLVRSPRIERILVEQAVPEDDEDDDYPEDVDDDRHECALRAQLEDLYHGPSAGDYREG